MFYRCSRAKAFFKKYIPYILIFSDNLIFHGSCILRLVDWTHHTIEGSYKSDFTSCLYLPQSYRVYIYVAHEYMHEYEPTYIRGKTRTIHIHKLKHTRCAHPDTYSHTHTHRHAICNQTLIHIHTHPYTRKLHCLSTGDNIASHRNDTVNILIPYIFT